MALFERLWLVLFAWSWVVFGSQIQGRIEHIHGAEPVSSRLIVKPQIDETWGDLKLYSNLFFENDLHSKIPYSGNKKVHFFVNETYLNFAAQDFSFRVGRQALRWSEAWALPSLDIWTARRWDRFFFDPLEDQLKHPTGFLIQFLQDKYELETFISGQTPQHDFPAQQPELAETWKFEGGFKGKIRIGGFDNSVLVAQARSKKVFGIGSNFAFEEFVPKIELGLLHQELKFLMLGSDFFWGQISVFPQIILSKSETEMAEKIVFYIPFRFEEGKNKFEFQFFSNKKNSNFWGVEWTRTLDENFSAAVFLQDYEGPSQEYLGLVNAIIGRGVFLGLRLVAIGGF